MNEVSQRVYCFLDKFNSKIDFQKEFPAIPNGFESIGTCDNFRKGRIQHNGKVYLSDGVRIIEIKENKIPLEYIPKIPSGSIPQHVFEVQPSVDFKIPKDVKFTFKDQGYVYIWYTRECVQRFLGECTKTEKITHKKHEDSWLTADNPLSSTKDENKKSQLIITFYDPDQNYGEPVDIFIPGKGFLKANDNLFSLNPIVNKLSIATDGPPQNKFYFEGNSGKVSSNSKVKIRTESKQYITIPIKETEHHNLRSLDLDFDVQKAEVFEIFE